MNALVLRTNPRAIGQEKETRATRALDLNIYEQEDDRLSCGGKKRVKNRGKRGRTRCVHGKTIAVEGRTVARILIMSAASS